MRKLFLLLSVVIIITACSTEPRYTIKGDIEGADSVTFYLQKREAGGLVTLDSALARNGSFRIKGGAVDFPQMVILVARETMGRISFYIENSNITITGKLDSIADSKITGSKTHDEYTLFMESNKPLNDQYSGIYNEYQIASQEKNEERMAELQKQAENIQEQMKALQLDFIRSNPSSYFSPSLLQGLSYELDAQEIESYISGMDTNVANIPIMLSLKERVEQMKSVSVGQKAPDFTLNDVDGNPVSLYSKVGPRLLLLDFWAAWCGPCRQENPHVVKVYKEFNKKGFDVFGVSLDRTREDWVKAIADDKLTWTHVSDLQYWNSAAARMYAVNSIPANFLLNENGTIVARNLRGDALYNKVNEVLGEVR